MNPFLLVLFVYGFFLVLIGIFLSRKVLDSADFFVAGRQLGPGLLFSTLLAANIGAGSTVGAAGLGYRLGLSAWWWVGSAALGSFVLAFAVGPRIRELAERHGFLTVGDFLEQRYDRSVRLLCAVLLWVGTLAILAGQLIAVSLLLEAVAGTNKTTGCLLGGLIIAIYFSAGGLKGTAWVNLIQLLVKGAGFLLAVPLTISASGGWEAIQNRLLSQGQQSESYFRMTGVGVEGIAVYLTLLLPAFIVSPGLLQKVYGARSSQAVRIGVGVNAVVLAVYSFFPVLLGMAAAGASPGFENAEQALPYVMTEMAPFWLGALLLAAVFSAEISSADAVLFMLSTSLTRDLYQTFYRPKMDEKALLRISRWTSVVAGALGVGLAIVLPSVILALTLFYTLISVTYFTPVVLGLYSRTCPAKTCFVTIVISVTATVVFFLATAGQGWSILTPTAFGILISALIFLLSILRLK